MSSSPVICLGQQPCGIFPRRFLFAKFLTARRLQQQIGGEIVFFYHDSDHDPRKTRTILRHRKSDEVFEINFSFENKLQRKYSPLFLKRIMTEWRTKTKLQLPAYIDRTLVDLFNSVTADNVADFCLAMYDGMGLLTGMRIMRSSDPQFRQAACDVSDYFVDVPHEGEIVRARHGNEGLSLHQGGDSYLKLADAVFEKNKISPTRDSRLRWMQSVIHCTHYVAGAGEQDYLCEQDAPEITYVKRDTIERPNEAYTQI